MERIVEASVGFPAVAGFASTTGAGAASVGVVATIALASAATLSTKSFECLMAAHLRMI